MLHLSASSTHRLRAGILAMLGWLGTAGAARAQTPASFAPYAAYWAGYRSSPSGVAVADVNGDTRPDMVTSNAGTSIVEVHLGQAGGGFALATAYSTGINSTPEDVAVADMNGDGRLDIVVVNRDTHSVGVLLGQAGGGFAAVSSYFCGFSGYPRGLAVLDINGDGRLDVVTANYYSNSVGVLLGQASGGFAAVSTYPTGQGPTAVAVADVNNDGRLDMVTSNYGGGFGSVGVLLGLAGGGFAGAFFHATGGNFPNDVTVADLNGDSRPDIVTANSENGTVGVLLGQASGTFAPVVAYSTAYGGSSYPHSVVVADVNGDSRADIVTANAHADAAGVLLGQAGGGFAAVSLHPVGTGNGYPISVTIGDINRDGRPDIVTANAFGDAAVVLLNSGTFTPLAAAPHSATAAPVSVFPNPARGSFTVQLPAAWGTAAVRAELHNALGQVVRRPVAGGAGLCFATAGLAPGVYVLRVQAGRHAVARRVVVE